MFRLLVHIGVLASLLFAGGPGHPLLEFTLRETPEQLAQQFDRAPQLAAGPSYELFQFHALAPRMVEAGLNADWLANANNAACNGRYAFTAYYNAERQLVSILHQPDRHLPVRLFFPEGSYESHEVEKAGGVKLYFKVRRLDGERVLVAVFYARDVRFIDQVLLVRSTHVATAFPDLANWTK